MACFFLQVGVLADAVQSILTEQLRNRFVFNAALVTLGMVASIMGALILASAMAAWQLIAAARIPLIKMQSTKAPPAMPLRPGHRWHMFLSHSEIFEVEPTAQPETPHMLNFASPHLNVAVWGTGQDQCATIKRQLNLLMPGVSIFLDVRRSHISSTPVRCR